MLSGVAIFHETIFHETKFRAIRKERPLKFVLACALTSACFSFTACSGSSGGDAGSVGGSANNSGNATPPSPAPASPVPISPDANDSVRVVALSNQNVSRDSNFFNHCVCPRAIEFPFINTSDYHIFEDEDVVIEVEIFSNDGAQTFSIETTAHFLSAEGDLDAWVNNQYSDHFQNNPATLISSTALPAEVSQINSTMFLRTDESFENYDFFRVEYYVDNYSDDQLSVMSFTSEIEMPVRVRNLP